MLKNQDVGAAVKALKEGKRIAREGWNDKNMFVFMQIPSVIGRETVPNVYSLPPLVKAEFEKRFSNPNNQINAIYYENQMGIVNESNSIQGWSPSGSDLLATDWCILD